jgi:hypothetical protein
LVLLRLLEAWRISPRANAHHVSVLGQPVSYPAANAAALGVLVLALIGALAAFRALSALARELTAARRLANRISRLAMVCVDGALVLDDARPGAFCAGLLRPRVYVTRGALAMLDAAAFEAVLAHERHHAKRRDPLRLAMSRVLSHALFFLPSLRRLGQQREALAELGADESAASGGAESRSALARAMLLFCESSAPGEQDGVDPARIDHLLGESLRWRFPVALCAVTVLLLCLLIALVVLVGREATGAATLAPPFLSAQPCVLILALIPAATGAVVTGRRLPFLWPSALSRGRSMLSRHGKISR